MRNHHQKAQKHHRKRKKKNTNFFSRLRAKNKSRRQNKKYNSHGPAGATKQDKFPLWLVGQFFVAPPSLNGNYYFSNYLGNVVVLEVT